MAADKYIVGIDVRYVHGSLVPEHGYSGIAVGKSSFHSRPAMGGCAWCIGKIGY